MSEHEQQGRSVAAPIIPQRQGELPHRPTAEAAEAEEAWRLATGFTQVELPRLIFLRWLYRQGHWTDGV